MNPKILIQFVRDLYASEEFIPLHAPTFAGNEKAYLEQCIDSTFVSSVGAFVEQFEQKVAHFTGARRAIATVNGTAALHTALYASGIERGDLVITQPLTFVATCNALFHLGAEPVFVDIERTSLGLNATAVEEYLQENALKADSGCIHKKTQQAIKAVLPMHTFGHPVDLDALLQVCQAWNLTLIEDAAEAIGSYYKGQHAGTVGEIGVLSFNGNKVITTGGGGMLLCNKEALANQLKHLTTTAKIPHPYEFHHDQAGFNYRMPNLNAALGCAQMEQLGSFLQKKRQLAQRYQEFFQDTELSFVKEPSYAQSNYWLNAVICPDQATRDTYLSQTNAQKVMTRPVWQLMHHLPMFKDSLRGDLSMAENMAKRLLNLPSSPI